LYRAGPIKTTQLIDSRYFIVFDLIFFLIQTGAVKSWILNDGLNSVKLVAPWRLSIFGFFPAKRAGRPKSVATLLVGASLTYPTNIININHIVIPMKSATRMVKSYSIDPEIGEYVAATKGDISASERVNDLLRRAIIQEREEKLEAEAAAFFASLKGKRRKTALDFQRAALRTFERD
jgi:hypothetical protein